MVAACGGGADRPAGRAGRRKVLIKWGSVAAVAILLVLVARLLPLAEAVAMLRGWLEGLGAWGVAAYVIAYVVAALLLLPCWILTIVAGAVYGLWWGTALASVSSTLAAAAAFVAARYAAREPVRRRVARSRKLSAVDRVVGERGWKVVALLRLSPAVPFTLQNYLYGVTSIRFWPCMLASWIAMLPGTFLYVYLGSLGGDAAGGDAADGDEATAGRWALRGIGLLATAAVTIYLARLARQAIREQAGTTELDSEQG